MKLVFLLRALSIGLWLLPPLFAHASSVDPDGLRLDDLRQTRERPLFSTTRRPPPKITPMAPIAAIAAPAPVVPPTLSLVGIVLGKGERKVIFTRTANDKPTTARLGEDVDGWHIASIEPRAFILQRDSRSVTITFPSSATGTAGTGAPAVAGTEAPATAGTGAPAAPPAKPLPKGLAHIP